MLKTPPEADINTMLANYQNGQHGKALELALIISEKFPDHLLSWKVLGAIFGQSRQLEEALIANQHAVRLAPGDAESHNNLANVLKGLGRLKDAEACYRQALNLKSDYPEAHFNLGNMLIDLGRLEEAEACYRKTLGLNQDYYKAIEPLGAVLMKRGKHTEGLKYLRLACGSIFFNIDNGLSIQREL